MRRKVFAARQVPNEKEQNMKREENKKQAQSVQTEQKDKPVILVRSGLRAGAISTLRGCIDI